MQRLSITHIVHLADVHLRTGSCREEEYTAVFEALKADIQARCQHAAESCSLLIVVCGDVFHNKNKFESTTLRLWNKFTDALTEIAPVAVICGNHDYRQECPEMPDSLEVLIERPHNVVNPKALRYMKRTGVYKIGDLQLGVVSVKDTLNALSTAGTVAELPPFPRPDRRMGVQRAVALFHGTVHESTTTTLEGGVSATNFIGAYPLSWIEAAGYDAVLLGDNHRQQVGRTPSGLPWGYPGSLVQQDVGEPLYGHGYLLWDLEALTATAVDVPNPYGRVKAAFREGQLLLQIAPKLWMKGEDAVADARFPATPVISVCGSTDDEEAATVALLTAWGKPPSHVHRSSLLAAPLPAAPSGSGEQDAIEPGKRCEVLLDLANPEHWLSYLRTSSPSLADEVQRHHWLDNPTSLAPSTEGIDALPRDLQAKLLNAREKVDEVVRNYNAHLAASSAAAATEGSVRLRHMQWSWAFSYGNDNWFDFDALRGRIALLNGPNASGKSSFIDVVCIALFGEPGRDRLPHAKTRKMSARFMHAQRPARQDLATRLLFDAAGGTYEITRKYGLHQTKGVDDAVGMQAELYSVDLATGVKTLVAQDSLVTQWVETHCGTVEAAQRTAIVAQTDVHHFFTLKPADQIRLVDDAVNLKALQLYADAVKAARTAYDTLIVGLSGAISALADNDDDEDGGGGGDDPVLDEDEDEDEAADDDGGGDLQSRIKRAEKLQHTHARLTRERDELAAACGTYMRNPPTLDADACNERVRRLEAALRALPTPTASMHKLLADKAVLLHKRDSALDAIRGAGDAVARVMVDEAVRRSEQAQRALYDGDALDKAYADAVLELQNLNDVVAGKEEEAAEYETDLGALVCKNDEWAANRAWWRADVLRERIELWQAMRSKREDGERRARDVEQMLGALRGLPFNPDCAACNANPEHVRRAALQVELAQVKEELESLPSFAEVDKNGTKLRERLEKYELVQSRIAELRADRDAVAAELECERAKRDKVQQEVDGLLARRAAAGTKEQRLQGVADAQAALAVARAEAQRAEVEPQLAAIDTQIERRKALEAVQREHDDAVAAEAWHAHAATIERIDAVARDLQAVHKLVAVAEAARARTTAARGLRWRLEDWKARRDALAEVYARLVDAKHAFGQTFKDWVYSTHIVPMLEARINAFFAGLDSLRVRVSYSTSGNNNYLSFFVIDRGSETLLSAASGYQQFLANLAMRQALATIGKTGHVLRHVIVDEGFTACDANNLEKVGQVLQQLLDGLGLASILVVTHLDAVKDAVPLRINVRRDGAFSSLRYGRQYPALRDAAATPTRRRRTVREFM